VRQDAYNFSPERFIAIEGGWYDIGAPAAVLSGLIGHGDTGELKPEYLLSASPPHRVPLKSFSVSRLLVTLEDFERFVLATGYLTEAEQDDWGWVWDGGWRKRPGASWREPFRGPHDDIYRRNRSIVPVLQTSWNDATAWCAWLTAETGRAVRLPTEYEWEVFALNAGTERMERMDPRGYRVDGDAGPFLESLLVECARDASMHSPGLVWEWTQDWFTAYPEGADGKDYGDTYRVLRGGSLASNPVQRGRDFRFRRCPTARSPFYGFRMALEP
jgi:formylglycine-generating enzyme required for sulfatase activity